MSKSSSTPKFNLPSYKIIILSYKNLPDLKRCIYSLYQISAKNILILQTDDGSLACQEALKYLQLSKIEHIRIPKNEFKHGLTRQKGIDAIKEEFALFLSADAQIQSIKSIEALLNTCKDPQIAGCFGRHIPDPKHGKFESFMRNIQYGEHSYTIDKDRALSIGPRALFFSNAFSLFRSQAIRKVGGFMPSSFGEDTLTCAKLLSFGYKIAYCAQATVQHSHNMNFVQRLRRMQEIAQLHQQFSSFFTPYGKWRKSAWYLLGSILRYKSARCLDKLYVAIYFINLGLFYTLFRLKSSINFIDKK